TRDFIEIGRDAGLWGRRSRLRNGELKPIKDWPKVWRTTLSGMDVVEMVSADSASHFIFDVVFKRLNRNMTPKQLKVFNLIRPFDFLQKCGAICGYHLHDIHS
ncbi:hypothetical protein ACUODJ_48975, partial [Escherichia sp. HC-CC]